MKGLALGGCLAAGLGLPTCAHRNYFQCLGSTFLHFFKVYLQHDKVKAYMEGSQKGRCLCISSAPAQQRNTCFGSRAVGLASAPNFGASQSPAPVAASGNTSLALCSLFRLRLVPLAAIQAGAELSSCASASSIAPRSSDQLSASC